MPAWSDMFAVSTPLLELFLRGTVTYLALTVLMRLVGQREAGGLGLTDLLVVVLAADAAGVGLQSESGSLTDSFVMVVTILLWSVVIDAASYRWPGVARVMKARPKLLVEQGELNRPVMHREFMSRDEILSQLRLHGVTDPSDVALAYIEPNGMVSVIRRDGDVPDEPEAPPMS